MGGLADLAGFRSVHSHRIAASKAPDQTPAVRAEMQ